MPENPLLSTAFRIPFDEIRTEHVVPGARAALSRARDELGSLVADEAPRTYESTVGRLDGLLERLDRVAGVIGHLVAVQDSPELREAYQTVQPEITEFRASLVANEGLWQALKAFAESEEAQALDPLRRRHLDKTVRAFVRAGADLPARQKARVVEIQVALAKLGKRYSENVLDATNAFDLRITDPADLAGLPESAIEQARARAEAKDFDGWRFTLQAPSYIPFMEYAENRELRRRMYQAFGARATEEERDNRPLIREILALRRELAGVLGYADFADLTLEERMAKDGRAALEFVRDLAERTGSYFAAESGEIEAFAREELGIEDLQPWDVAFTVERMRRARYDLDPEALRPYFPLGRVLEGLFGIAHRLFGVTVTEREIEEVWHPDVRFYDIRDEDGTHLGSFYADYFPREEKRGGAWMNDLITGGPRADGFEPHLGLIACNFTPPTQGRPALLTHDEVQTLFHEFGHLLHHCLSRVEVPALSGTNVAWDFVELPSQILENWTWEREALDLFARHYETDEPIPEELYERMVAARAFMGASAQMRQLGFGTVDLRLHVEYDPASEVDPLAFGGEALRPFALRPEWANPERLAAFTHVFAGGYAAGYYSYKWAEVLDADAFGRFREEGLFNPETGRAYRDSILARGDSADPAELFRAFMGRDPDPEALLLRTLGREPAAA